VTRAGPGRGTAEGGRVSPWQVALLLVTAVAIQDSTSINRLLTPLAGRDLWISILLAVPPGFAGVLVLLALAGRHRGRDLAALLRDLLGPLAYPVALAYAALFLAAAAESGAEFTALSHLVFISTPPSAFEAPLVLAAAYASYLGVEVLARVNSLLLLGVSVPLGVILLFLFAGQEHLVYLLPVLARGLPRVLAGARLVLGTLGEFVLLLVLLPLTERPRAAARASLWALAIACATALGHNLGPLLVFGDAARRFTWPLFEQVDAIDVGRFLERLDVVAIWLWVHGIWLEVALFLHAAALTLANLFGLRSHRPLVGPLAALIFAGALAVPNQAVSMRLRWDLDAVAFPLAGFGVPLLLLVWSAVRGRRPARGERLPGSEAAR
jgi:spore germination protein KB